MDPITNVVTCRTAPGYSKFVAFCVEAGFDDEEEPLAFEANWVTDDEEEEHQTNQHADQDKDAWEEKNFWSETPLEDNRLMVE